MSYYDLIRFKKLIQVILNFSIKNCLHKNYERNLALEKSKYCMACRRRK